MRRIVVTGSRDWTRYDLIEQALESEDGNDDFLLIHGDCRGADKMAERAAKARGWSVKRMPANWREHGKAAGPIRNRAMLDLNPDMVLAFIMLTAIENIIGT